MLESRRDVIHRQGSPSWASWPGSLSYRSIPTKKDAAPGTPARGKYALGWGEVLLGWSPEPLIYHGGSNEKNLAHFWIEPKGDFAMVLVTNIGGSKADDALNALAPYLYARFAAPKRRGKGAR